MKGMTVTVRVATVSDADAIAQLTAQLGYEVALAAVSARLSRILPREDQRLLVAELDGRLVGWLHAIISEYVEAEACVVIGGLVVDRGHRRMGIGSLLMEQAEQWAKERGCPIVRLRSSSVRTAAHRFYEELGYTNIKTQYSFVKSLDAAEPEHLSRFVPRVEE